MMIKKIGVLSTMLLICGLVMSPGYAQAILIENAGFEDPNVVEARGIVKEFFKKLSGELKSGMNMWITFSTSTLMPANYTNKQPWLKTKGLIF